MATNASIAGFKFRPDPDDAAPIYRQLATRLVAAIRAGGIVVGTRLPSERLYARTLGVSRTTVTSAYQELKAMGLLRGHVGRGAVVIADDPDRASVAAISWPLLAARPPRTASSAGAALAPDVVSLGDGWLHPTLVPEAALTSCAAKVVRNSALLTRPAPIPGLPELRDALLDKLRADGIKAAPGEILVTGGAQQGLNVVARALLSPGEAVITETPTWHGALRAFRAVGAEVAGVPMDHEGIDPGALEDALVRRRPKFVYLIPSFHCPTGRLMSLERRRQVLEICARFRTPIVESHVYGDTAFADAPPALKRLDEAGIVIHQGSVSKTIGMALRLGWLVAAPAAMDLLAPAKASLDLSTPALGQAILAAFLGSGAYARHVRQLRTDLRARRDALLAALAAHCPELRSVTPQGGLYVWAQLPQPLRANEVEAAAAAEAVAVRGGDAFLPDGAPSSHIRLCYAAPAPDEIPTGAKRLGKALRRLLQQHQGQSTGASRFAPV